MVPHLSTVLPRPLFVLPTTFGLGALRRAECQALGRWNSTALGKEGGLVPLLGAFCGVLSFCSLRSVDRGDDNGVDVDENGVLA